MTNQKRGIFEGVYFIEKGKIYFGITDNIQEDLINGFVNIIDIYLPKTIDFPCEEVYSFFSKNKIDMLSVEDMTESWLKGLQENIPECIIIQQCNSSIKVYGESNFRNT